LDGHGKIMIDYLEQGKTINGTYYADELWRLRQKVARHRRDKLTQGVLLGLHDNAPAHTSKIAMAAASDCGFEILPYPHIFRTLPPLTSTCFRNWKPSFVVNVLEAMKVSWRRSMNYLRTKIVSTVLKG
jgi:hypothetical protein